MTLKLSGNNENIHKYIDNVKSILFMKGYSRSEVQEIFSIANFIERINIMPEYYFHYVPEAAVQEILDFVYNENLIRIKWNYSLCMREELSSRGYKDSELDEILLSDNAYLILNNVLEKYLTENIIDIADILIKNYNRDKKSSLLDN